MISRKDRKGVAGSIGSLVTVIPLYERTPGLPVNGVAQSW